MKKDQQNLTLQLRPNPEEVGVPCAVVMVEMLCTECKAGVMRPTGRMMNSRNGALVMHQCTACEHVAALPQPYPHPDFSPMLDISKSEDALALVAKSYEERKKDQPQPALKLVTP